MIELFQMLAGLSGNVFVFVDRHILYATLCHGDYLSGNQTGLLNHLSLDFLQRNASLFLQ
jgi:hypothetical protein